MKVLAKALVFGLVLVTSGAARAAADPVCSYTTPQYCASVATLFSCPVPLDAQSISAIAGQPAVVPYVRLATDPCDSFLSSEDACTTLGAPSSLGLNGTLTDEQEALLGCGPFWGTDCEMDGIDLTNAEASVLLQSFPGVGGVAALPGSRGPNDPGYDRDVDGSVGGLPTPSGEPFRSEMAALSWNLLMTLVAFSQAPDPSSPGDHEFDPGDPTRTGPGLCSFAQPQYCASVQCLIAPEAGSTWSGVIACLVIRRLRRKERRGA